MRTVVVGSSSGLERCIGVELACRGSPSLRARRHDRLARAAALPHLARSGGVAAWLSSNHARSADLWRVKSGVEEVSPKDTVPKVTKAS